MKKGDKVYRAHEIAGGVQIGEALVVSVGSSGVKLSARVLVWGCRSVVPYEQCHSTRRAALEALLRDRESDLLAAQVRLERVASALAAEPTP